MVARAEQISSSSSDIVVTPSDGQAVTQPQFEWDAVAEASWESFPASDPPAWNGGRSIALAASRARGS
jgi:hypothetical protein